MIEESEVDYVSYSNYYFATPSTIYLLRAHHLLHTNKNHVELSFRVRSGFIVVPPEEGAARKARDVPYFWEDP